jgi:histidinol phosphatase-like PHP family hydrolase
VIKKAEEIGLRTLAFTEHVRRNSNWVPNYLKEIEFFSTLDKRSPQARAFPKIISGFEAKILKDGSIDCREEYSENHFLISSFHTIFGNKETWINALRGAIENPHVDVIGHLAPEPSFNLNAFEVHQIAKDIARNGKIVELNAKYHRPPLEWIYIFKKNGVRFHLGSDAHSLDKIGQFSEILDLISAVED